MKAKDVDRKGDPSKTEMRGAEAVKHREEAGRKKAHDVKVTQGVK